MLKLSIIGWANRPELKYSRSGVAMFTFSVRVPISRKDESGEWKRSYEYVNVTQFGQAGQTLADRLTEGSKVYVSGRAMALPYVSRQSEPRAGLSLTADTVEIVAPPGDVSTKSLQDGLKQPRPSAPSTSNDDIDSLPF